MLILSLCFSRVVSAGDSQENGSLQTKQTSVDHAELPEAYKKVYAMINGKPELLVSFQDFYQYKRKNKYYHGKPPESELQTFIESVQTELIDQILVHDYIDKNFPDFIYDQQEIDLQVKRFDEQMAGVESWNLVRVPYLAVYERRLIRDLLYRAYKDQFEAAIVISDDEIKNFYNDHPEKFTQPPRSRVSLILLGVDPSAGVAAWKESEALLNQIRFRIVNGESFAEMAKEFSTDPSSKNNGDMGFVHKGSISSVAQEAIDTLAPGEMTPVLTLLQGLALFQLTERVESEHHAFDEVKERASSLALQNKKVKKWNAFIESLRADAKVDILIKNES